MPRYSESRQKFPVHIDLAVTTEQKRRADMLAERWRVKRNEAIRRCIDAHYLSELSHNSIDQTVQPGDQTP
jgi:hypothetical protein